MPMPICPTAVCLTLRRAHCIPRGSVFWRVALLVASAIQLTAACGKRSGGDAGHPPGDSIAGASAITPGSSADSRNGLATPDSDGKISTPGTLATRVMFTAAQVEHGGVRWAVVEQGLTAGRATIPGEVVPNENRTIRLGAPGRGRIIAVRVQPGQRVSRGQELVVLQSPEAGSAQADVKKAAAELTLWKARGRYADAARGRAERLLALKAIPQQDYERAIVDDEETHAALAQAESEFTRATSTANQLGAGNASLTGEFVIRSTMSGVVLARTAAPGAVVDAGAPLMVITDPSSLWLSINASEQLALLFRRGERVSFTVPAYPADTFAASIDAVGAGLDSATRTLAARAVIQNVAGKLRPAMLASVVVESSNSLPAVLVPEEAVQTLGGKPNVFLARPDGKGGLVIERREIEIGSRFGGRIAVTRGLAAGEVIVTAGAFAVKADFQKATLPKDEG